MGQKVTIKDINDSIASEHYFTASEALVGQTRGPEWQATPVELDTLTFCVLVMKNGCTVTGQSNCVSREDFDAAKGRKLAREHAVIRAWELMGFALKDRLAVTK